MRVGLLLGILLLGACAVAVAQPGQAMLLDRDWRIQSSAQVQANGETISSTAFAPSKWYVTSVPSTVVAALVENKVYPDPYFGMNLRSIPGTTYRIGQNFSNVPMPNDSPFHVSWWFRKEFHVQKRAGENIWLQFDGINFRANVWINGKLLADSKRVAGAYRTYEFNITENIAAGKPNILAVEVFPPEPTDLAITWVDWNPMPPDKNMGIWRDVRLKITGPVSLRYPQVTTKIDMPALDRAHLTVSAELHNAGNKSVTAWLKGGVGSRMFGKSVELAPRETKLIAVTEQECGNCLRIDNPRLWWPTQVGPQNMYEMKLTAEIDKTVSDQETIRYGIREMTSELNDKNYRVFRVNGKPILIRGGGWASDMLLRPSAQREIDEIRYVKDMNLNTIRFEAKIESNRFLELCDREGILVIAGWCCCDHWEKWQNWDDEDYEISALSLRDQVRRIRNHPSILAWFYGSDGPPPPKAEERYLQVLKDYQWPNPYLSSAAANPTPAGLTGVRMTGPYEWVPPMYWYVDTTRGGAYSFNTETSPGPAVPPVESLRRMLPKEHLWPIDEFWDYHAGGGAFKNLKVFTDAMNARFSEAKSIEDYARKAQIMAYDGERAMFEAYGRNKYASTGVIQWMMNNAWPSMIWHLYDYYLRPAGGYFGTKKACEPLHIQYSYDDRSVAVLNSYYREYKNLKATAKVYNLDMSEKFTRQQGLDAGPDSSSRAFVIPEIPGLSPTYFLKLTLEDPAGELLSSNFYWLSTKMDVLDDAKATWYYTPVKSHADYTALSSLPQAKLKLSARREQKGSEEIARVSIENPGPALAFFVHLKLVKERGGEEVLPILWQDNYFSLMPGEKREVAATCRTGLLGGPAPFIEVEGWNITPAAWPVSR